MKFREFRDVILSFGDQYDDLDVFFAKDAEGNGFRPVDIPLHDNGYMDDDYEYQSAANWEEDQKFMTSQGWDEEEYPGDNALVLWPA